jgi:hypothetical protein
MSVKTKILKIRTWNGPTQPDVTDGAVPKNNKLLVHAHDVKMNVCMLIKIEMLNSITVYLFF